MTVVELLIVLLLAVVFAICLALTVPTTGVRVRRRDHAC